jgi:hypothetical protein
MKEQIKKSELVVVKVNCFLLFAAFVFGALSTASLVEQILLANGKGIFASIMFIVVCAGVIYFLFRTGQVKKIKEVENSDCEGCEL